MIQNLEAFLVVSAIVICTPGPDTALIVRNTLAAGRRAGLGTAVGIVTGIVVWTLAASAGLAAVLSASRRAFRQGLLSNLGNPKIAVFFVSLLPQFVAEGGSSFLALVVLGGTFCLLGLVWLALYAVVVARLGAILHGSLRRAIDAVTGAALVAFGLRMASAK